MQIAEQLAVHLHNKGLGLFTKESNDGNIYIDFVPSLQNSITIINRPGNEADIRNSYKTSGVQIYYRGTDNPLTSYEKAEEIFNALNGLKGKLNSSYVVQCFSFQSGPENVGRSENGWFEFSMNFLIYHAT